MIDDALAVITLLFILMGLIWLFKLVVEAQRNLRLRRELGRYDQVLRLARRQRLAFIRMVEQTDGLRRDLEYHRNALAVERARLAGMRAQLRKLVKDLRQRSQEQFQADYQLRVIEQQQVRFRQEWAVFGGRKRQCGQAREELSGLREQLERGLVREEQLAREWARVKQEVLGLWKRLSGRTMLPDPRISLGTN